MLFAGNLVEQVEQKRCSGRSVAGAQVIELGRRSPLKAVEIGYENRILITDCNSFYIFSSFFCRIQKPFVL